MSVHIRGTASARKCKDSAALAPADTQAAAGTWSGVDTAPGQFIQYLLFIVRTQAGKLKTTR